MARTFRVGREQLHIFFFPLHHFPPSIWKQLHSLRCEKSVVLKIRGSPIEGFSMLMCLWGLLASEWMNYGLPYVTYRWHLSGCQNSLNIGGWKCQGALIRSSQGGKSKGADRGQNGVFVAHQHTGGDENLVCR